MILRGRPLYILNRTLVALETDSELFDEGGARFVRTFVHVDGGIVRASCQAAERTA